MLLRLNVLVYSLHKTWSIFTLKGMNIMILEQLATDHNFLLPQICTASFNFGRESVQPNGVFITKAGLEYVYQFDRSILGDHLHKTYLCHGSQIIGSNNVFPTHLLVKNLPSLCLSLQKQPSASGYSLAVDVLAYVVRKLPF